MPDRDYNVYLTPRLFQNPRKFPEFYSTLANIGKHYHREYALHSRLAYI
jgi:hypothetical protein